MSDTWWLDLTDLDQEQSDIIDLATDKSYVIFGPPGSGKSNLLLLRANFLYLGSHPNIQIIVFTRTLQEFIASGGTQYDFPSSKLKTSRRFFQNLLYQNGITLTLPKGFDECRRILLDEVSRLVKAKALHEVYDTILLDEAQDYLPEEIALFRQLSKHLFAVADSRQKIYKGDDAIAAITAATDEQRNLQIHYRISRKICKVADALMKDSGLHTPMAPGAQYKEHLNPSEILPFQYSSLTEQADHILESLKAQVQAFPGQMLGVLCPKLNIARDVGEIIRNSELADLLTVQGDSDTISFTQDKRILVCTIHAAKGLEFRTVHIPGAEALAKFRHQKNLAFTAITRAKTTVYIYHSEDLPGYLAEALQTVMAPKPLPEKKHAFGKKKK